MATNEVSVSGLAHLMKVFRSFYSGYFIHVPILLCGHDSLSPFFSRQVRIDRAVQFGRTVKSE